MSIRQMELEVMRYDPEKDKEPWFQSYSVPCEDDWAILDAINYVKDNIDTTLSYRWSCHMMVCGSCGMMVNGEPSLTCKTFIRNLPDKVRIEPLENFPIERDLVVVLDDVMQKLHKVQPYIIRKDDPPEGKEGADEHGIVLRRNWGRHPDRALPRRSYHNSVTREGDAIP